MKIEYKVNAPVSTDQFVELLKASNLAERRPVDDRVCMAGMLANSNLTVTAWWGGKLVGIARSVTDFHYACYLSDLAVHADYQKCGVGRQLQVLTQRQLGAHCKLILIAAPAANDYYPHVGYQSNPRCWVLDRDQCISR
ncbi:GNAT family N-acetyltransferase [Gilvimarinus sp. SDUM040013]|uniref:GNAT family N-acetyltransferase n=1 Tax=Gilvimarinus gilvus TaxID=3058038 RepID=A0ABU4RXN9_9GAMM|nr:GNAT family N-acetyltransferase [Gilvimarinus sp. SDUM040013]MDO3386371.1 GNAT family N-acetyltransferase [Gilvimarinus sp. SDUM040013]MDX6849637.1 GNAT family N-acetyltransferase [Gilvimarinus sp. SDUM040013]